MQFSDLIVVAQKAVEPYVRHAHVVFATRDVVRPEELQGCELRRVRVLVPARPQGISAQAMPARTSTRLAAHHLSVAAAMCGSAELTMEPHGPTMSAAADAPYALTQLVKILRSSKAALYGTSAQLGARRAVETLAAAARAARSRAPGAEPRAPPGLAAASAGWYRRPSPPMMVSR